ncbi:MFS transporter [Streptomyces sp. SDT5-1]|uniref:MFS transporter n=1 Tax=Streptomyces sp. SDT5-1 TaxID=3406418 RepID=UPI003FCFD792
MDCRLDHVGLNVRDLASQTSWYRAAFGLRTVFEFTLEGAGMSAVVLEHPDGWRIELLARAGSATGLRAPDPISAVLTEGYGHFAVTTPDLDAVHTQLLQLGARTVLEPAPLPRAGSADGVGARPRGQSHRTHREDGFIVKKFQQLDVRTLIACCLAVAAAQLCITVPSPINGEIQSAFGASGAQVAWVSSAFVLPTAILELNFGVVGDLFGRKRLLVIGGFTLALGELLNATAQNITMLWVGQVVAGIGAAALFPSSLAVIAAATPQEKDRARAVSIWAVSISLGSAVGPLSSGVLATVANFRFAFVPPIVLGVAVAVTAWLTVTDSRAPEGRSLDWPGQITIAIGLTALLWGVIEGGERGWGSPVIVTALIVAALALAAFVMAERRAATPMFHLELLKIPSFAAAAVVALVGMFGFIGTAYCVSIRLGAVMHLSALRAGMPFVILQFIPLLLAPLLSRMLSRIEARWLLMGGLIPMAAGQFWIAALPITTTSLLTFLGPVLLLGVGFICVVSSLTQAAVNAVPIRMTGMASGATSLVREFGQGLGPAVISTVAMSIASSALVGKLSGKDAGMEEAAGPLAVVSAGSDSARAAAQSALAHGMAVGVVICGCTSLVGALVTLLLVRGNKERTGQPVAGEPVAAQAV